jgi:nitrate/nitrite-specific signal transduction histidine kinase
MRKILVGFYLEAKSDAFHYGRKIYSDRALWLNNDMTVEIRRRG